MLMKSKIIKNGIVLEELEEIIEESQNQVQEPTLEEKVTNLQEENQMLKECILEMSEIIYGG